MIAPNLRPYRSELRETQARQTRARVLDAAATEFAVRGYAGTTLGAIAASAGVSVETVKLQGAKHELLLGAWQRRLPGGDAEVAAPILEDEARRAQIAELSDADLVASFVVQAAEISAAGSGLWQAFASAARFDPQVRAAFESTIEVRREEFRLIVGLLDARGMIRHQRPRAMLASELAVIASAEVYEQLVVDSGYTREQYEDWLLRAIDRLALAE
jgi:AcrR family transcriptional regulator